MITKNQYIEIIDKVQQYISKHKEAFPDKPLSNEFCAGIERTLDLIQTLVKNDT